MASRALGRRPTLADLHELPEHLVGEIVAGDLHASPRPAPRHANATSGLGAELWGAFHRGRGGPGGWWILDEPAAHLGADVLVPDLGGWRRERLPQLPEDAFFALSPDWVCEAVSASTERLDRSLKLPAYAREGVRHAWLLNPLARTLEVYRNENGLWVLLATHAGPAVVRAEPFDAIELDLAPLWGDPESR